MQKVLDVVVIAGFLLVDFFLFHDFRAPGETFTVVDYMIGMLSIIVIIRAALSLVGTKQ